MLPRSGKVLEHSKEHAATLNSTLLSWIDRARGASFFAYVHYMEPHMPLIPPEPFDARFDPSGRGGTVMNFPVYGPGILPFQPGPPMPDDELARLVGLYDGTIAYFDHEFGLLLDALEERGLGRNTLILLTSDHGEEFLDHGGWSHGHSLHEELIRVPLVAWCPDHLPGGRRVEGPFCHVDIMPTLVGAAGGEIDPDEADLDGLNLWKSLRGTETTPHDRPVFSECIKHGGEGIRALRAGSDKLIHAESRGREVVMLFDLSTDPTERFDLAAERPEVVNALRAWATDIQARARSRQRETEPKVMDEATEETLRALGYIQ
jgi:arylsulfatase A-like enzyme